MYYFYGKVIEGHIVYPLYGGGPYLGESVMEVPLYYSLIAKVTVDLEVFVLGSFGMINFMLKNFRRNNPLPS